MAKKNSPKKKNKTKAAIHAGARLYATPDNPIPGNARVGMITTPDGVQLRYARWEAALRPTKGTVLLLHGRTEFIEKYFEAVQDLRGRGFSVLTFDWRGQGGSSRQLWDKSKGHVENFNQYLTDLETILSEIALPDSRPPYYICAHSTGALVALLAAPALGNRVRRMVLCSPLLAINKLPMKQTLLQKMTGVLTVLGAGRMTIGKRNPNKRFIGNRLTSDTARFERSRTVLDKAPDLRTGRPTISWVFSACRAMATVNQPGYANAISIPTLLVAAGNDTVVDPGHIEAFGRQMRSGAFLTISGAKHELWDERDVFREQLLAAFDAFVPGTEV
ncbi:MAG: alpha/beta hydrolase [Pseudomonadota bacterium]